MVSISSARLTTSSYVSSPTKSRTKTDAKISTDLENATHNKSKYSSSYSNNSNYGLRASYNLNNDYSSDESLISTDTYSIGVYDDLYQPSKDYFHYWPSSNAYKYRYRL